MKTKKNSMLSLCKIASLRYALLFALITFFLFGCSFYRKKIDSRPILKGMYDDLESALASPRKAEYLLLNMKNNDVKSLPNEIYSLKNLKVLKIKFHDSLDVKDLFIKASKLPSLNTLVISSYNLKYFPDEILKLKNIKCLSIVFSNNIDLSDLFKKISNLQDLEKLSLTGGDFEYLPSEVGLLTNIKVLELGLVPLKEFPDEIGKLNLERLQFCQYPNFFRAVSNEEKLKLLELLPNTDIVLTERGRLHLLPDKEVKLTRDNLWEVKD